MPPAEWDNIACTAGQPVTSQLMTKNDNNRVDDSWLPEIEELERRRQLQEAD